MFKSYYVVWKHKRMQKDREKFKKFKSYYVVWKLFSDTKAFFRAYGLNRTMQYGNEKQNKRFEGYIHV